MLVLFSFLVTTIHQFQIQTVQFTENEAIDSKRAEQIMLTGIEIATYEWKYNANVRSDHTHGIVIDNLSILGGQLTVSFLDDDLNLADDASDSVTIRSVGTYNQSTKTVDVVLQINPTKRMLMFVPDPSSISSNMQDQIDSFSTWGWSVELIDDNADSDTITNAINDQKTDLIYASAGTDLSLGTTLKTFSVPIATEESSHWFPLGITNANATQTTLTTDIQANPSCQFCSSFSSTVTMTTTPHAFNRAASSTLASGALIEFLDISDNNYVTLALIPPGNLLADSTSAPQARIALPIAIDAGQTWNTLTSNGLALIQSYLDIAGCNYDSCLPQVELESWDRVY